MAKTVEYDTRVNDVGDVARVRFSTDHGLVRRFAVQYEAWIDGRYRPIVRFDNADGASHRDLLAWDESTFRKDWSWEGAPLDPGQALTLALTEIRRDWEIYKTEFLRRGQ